MLSYRGTVRLLRFGQRRAAWYEAVPPSADPSPVAVTAAAGPVADEYFGGRRSPGITRDDRDCALALARFYRVDDLDYMIDQAEAAALEIIRTNRDVIEVLAAEFMRSPNGELFEREIEMIIKPYWPFPAPPDAPLPASLLL